LKTIQTLFSLYTDRHYIPQTPPFLWHCVQTRVSAETFPGTNCHSSSAGDSANRQQQTKHAY